MNTDTDLNDINGADAQTLRDAVERMHVNDRKRVAAGEINAQDLHFLPAAMVRESVVDWSTFMRREPD